MVVAAARRICLAAALGSALGGCVALDAYRSVSGLDKDDPGPGAPFSQNLAAGEAQDYPNLSTVPPPPTRASTVAERAELTKKLVAQRTTAEADASTVQPTPAPPQTPAAATPTRAAATPQTPAAAPTVVASAAPAAPSQPPAATPAAAPAAQPPAPAAPAASETRLAGNRRGSPPREAPPPESTLQMPVIPSVPEPEATQPPPAQARLGPAPSIGPNELPAARASVEMPAPAPPIPTLAPLAPAATPVVGAAPPPPVLAAVPEPRRLPQAASLAAFDLSDPPSLAPEQRARLTQIAAAYSGNPGTVKIVAYAAPAPGGPEQLASFRAALDRAQLVAAALTQAGVPSSKIQTEAAPAGNGAGAGRVEVRLAP